MEQFIIISAVTPQSFQSYYSKQLFSCFSGLNGVTKGSWYRWWPKQKDLNTNDGKLYEWKRITGCRHSLTMCAISYIEKNSLYISYYVKRTYTGGGGGGGKYLCNNSTRDVEIIFDNLLT